MLLMVDRVLADKLVGRWFESRLVLGFKNCPSFHLFIEM